MLTVSLALVGITLAIYANSLQGAFTNWDDNTLVLENESVKSLAPSNIVDIFIPQAGKTYQPLRVLSYAVNYGIAEFAPFGYHLVNTFLHAGAAVVLFFLVIELLPALRVKSKARERVVVAAFVAGLFACHPVNVESVAWISSRKYGLLALFFFLALWAHLKAFGAGDKRMRWQIGSWVAGLCAVLSSPFAVTLPAIILLLDYCRRGSLDPRPMLKERWAIYLPYAYCILAVMPLLMNVSNSEGVDEIAKPHFETPFVTFLTATAGISDYARNLTLPFWLNNRYSNRIVQTVGDAKFLAAFLGAIALITFVVCELRKGRKLALFCVGWFLITWSPVSNIIPISTVIADRYLYLPAVGLFLGLGLLLRRWKALPALGGVVILALCVGTVQRNKVWSSSIALWTDCIEKSPANYLAHNSLGRAWREEKEFDKAIACFREAVRVNPDYHLAHHGLADVLLNEKGQGAEALPHFEIYLKKKQDNALAWMNVGIIHGQTGDLDKAAEYFQKAVEVDPQSAMVQHNIGVLYTLTEREEEAVMHFRKAIELETESAQVYADLATVLKKLNRKAEALAAIDAGLVRFPQSAVLLKARPNYL